MIRNSERHTHYPPKAYGIVGLLSIFFLFLGGCASTYQAKAAAAQHAYFAGDYPRALELIDKVHPAPRDRLLFLLDRGIILQAAGNYEESNRTLEKAEEAAEALNVKSITKETAATLWSEEARGYPGERYEIAIIPVLRMLNYIMMDQWDEALVEVRRLGTTVERIYGPDRSFNNAFSTYLSAIIWEALGHLNDALIDYRRLATSKAPVPYYASDLKAMSSRLGLPTRLPSAKSTAWTTSRNYRKAKGELIVIALMGRSPHFVSEWVSTGAFTVSVPRLVRSLPGDSHTTVKADGRAIGRTFTFHDTEKDMLIALKERSKRSLIRSIVKTTVQTGLYTGGAVLMESDEVEEQLAGLALSILALSMAATDKADARSVRTLPAFFQIGRFYLAPGRHEIEVTPSGRGPAMRRTILLTENKPSIIIARFGSSSQSQTREKPARDELGRLRAAIRRKPSDGALKIALAEEMMRSGESDGIKKLILDGLKQGGNARKGTALMVAAFAVEGNPQEAAAWAERGKALSPALSYCAHALAALMGKRPPPSGTPPGGSTHAIENAVSRFIAGLLAEKQQDYESATAFYAKAYELGLRQKSVVKRVIANFQRTDESFRESQQGADILSRFAESFTENL